MAKPQALPWIGVTARFDADRRLLVQDQRYLDAIEWAGGAAVLIPPLSRSSLVAEYAARLDGLLLTGSPSDIAPERYGAGPHERLGRVDEARDGIDAQLMEIAERRRLPVLGICYGMQSLNVFRGGTLVQDIPSDLPKALPHNREGKPEEVKSHSVRIEGDSRLGALIGCDEIEVNSFHHQAVADAGLNLRVVAEAPDGVVEGIEDTRGRWVLGVQWHPETGWKSDPSARALFSGFVEAARKKQLNSL